MTTEPLSEAAGQHDPSTQSLDLRAYLAILRARKWIVFSVTTIVVVLTALFTFAATPIYRASCLLLIEPKAVNVSNVPGAYDPVGAGGWMSIDYYRTQYELFKSRRVAELAANALEIGKRPEFAGSHDLVQSFIASITVEPLRDSRLVRVSFDSADKRFAMKAVNAIVEQFIDDSRERTLGVSEGGLRKLRTKTAELRPKVEASARALQEFKEKNGLFAADETQSIALQQLRASSDELSRVRLARLDAEAEMRTVLKALEGSSELEFPKMQTLAVLNGLRAELAKLQADRVNLLERYMVDHPLVQAVNARIEMIRAQVKEEQRRAGSLAKNAYDLALAHENQLIAEVERARTEVADLDRTTVRLQLLKEEAETLAASYRNLTKRVEEIDVAATTGTKENNLFVIDPAIEPDVPIRPNKRVNLLLGVFSGLLGGVGLCFLLEVLDNTLKGREDIERLLGYPLLGFFPLVEAEPSNNGHAPEALELVSLRDPRARVAESFRTIRTSLAFTLAPGARALVVTSASARDGKTFTAVNLACTLAQTGKRVLLVDGDLRRPRLDRIFKVEAAERGLSTAIAGGGEAWAGAVFKTSAETLDVLPAGPIPPNPVELLGTPALKTLLERALEKYDWVIVDAPPLTPIADAATIVGHVPHVVLVVRAFATHKGSAHRARELLEQARGHVAGVIVNMVDSSGGEGAYGKYGDYGYGYGGYSDYYAGERRDADPSSKRHPSPHQTTK